MNYEREDAGQATTLRVRGELDALTVGDLRPLLDEIVEARRRDVTVDLADLRLVDSSGVGALVSLYKRVRAQGGEVRFVNVTSQPLVIFKLLRLDVVFDLKSDAQPQPEDEPAGELAPPSIRVLPS